MVVDYEETNCATIQLDDAVNAPCSAEISDLTAESNNTGKLLFYSELYATRKLF